MIYIKRFVREMISGKKKKKKRCGEKPKKKKLKQAKVKKFVN